MSKSLFSDCKSISDLNYEFCKLIRLKCPTLSDNVFNISLSLIDLIWDYRRTYSFLIRQNKLLESLKRKDNEKCQQLELV